MSIEETSEFQRTLYDSARLLGQNRPGEAVSLLLPLFQQASTHPDVAINLGGAYILQRKWDKAVRVLKAAAETHPHNAMLWMNLGAAQLGRLELSGPKQQVEAIVSFERALEADPFTANAHYQLGLILKDQGDLPGAASYFAQALKVQPADRDARYWLDRITKITQDE